MASLPTINQCNECVAKGKVCFQLAWGNCDNVQKLKHERYLSARARQQQMVSSPVPEVECVCHYKLKEEGLLCRVHDQEARNSFLCGIGATSAFLTELDNNPQLAKAYFGDLLSQ